MVIKTINGD